MRQYRGLTKEGKWVYGWYLEKEDSHCNTYSVIVFGRHFEVIPETVGQFTGLKDKNGTEIYKSDCFKKDGHIGIVEQAESGLWVIEWDDNTTTCLLCDNNFEWRCYNEKIIGNIYQPELMEQE